MLRLANVFLSKKHLLTTLCLLWMGGCELSEADGMTSQIKKGVSDEQIAQVLELAETIEAVVSSTVDETQSIDGAALLAEATLFVEAASSAEAPKSAEALISTEAPPKAQEQAEAPPQAQAEAPPRAQAEAPPQAQAEAPESATQAALSPADQLIELLTAFDSLKANFEQRSARSEPQSGRIWLSKPNQFRLESDEPLSQTVVSDGTTLWTFDRDLEQVIITDVQNESSEIPLLVFAGEPGQIKALYSVERFADEERLYFLLTPLDDGMTASLSLTFQNGTPVRMTLENTMGQQTSIDLSDVSKAKLDSDLYQFRLPEDVDIIDDRVVPPALDAPDF